METQAPPFQEAHLFSSPIRDLGLRIEGTPLEPVLAEFMEELDRAGIHRVRPRFYLSSPQLTALHAERTGHVEGVGRADLLRYLRHEMGHVVSYAYKLYEDEEWVKLFGSMTQPYREEYRPEPFSRRHVRHLPGWYAQKHPDEDWAETFAVWMTPGFDWHAEYAGWPVALAKLEHCDRAMAALADREPLVTDDELDEDVGEIQYSLEHYYGKYYGSAPQEDLPPGLDGALRSIFEDLGRWEDLSTDAPRQPASDLIRRLARDLPADVYRWTGHFPERTRVILEGLARRAEELRQVYPADREMPAVMGITTLVTALAMNHVHTGKYIP
jgi:hypothetical protein